MFDQGRQLWAGLEDYLLTHAATFDRRLVVVTGPGLQPSDPTDRRVQLPLRFFKVAGFPCPAGSDRTGTGRDGDLVLAATSYRQDQARETGLLGALIDAAHTTPPHQLAGSIARHCAAESRRQPASGAWTPLPVLRPTGAAPTPVAAAVQSVGSRNGPWHRPSSARHRG